MVQNNVRNLYGSTKRSSNYGCYETLPEGQVNCCQVPLTLEYFRGSRTHALAPQIPNEENDRVYFSTVDWSKMWSRVQIFQVGYFSKFLNFLEHVIGRFLVLDLRRNCSVYSRSLLDEEIA